MTFYAEGLEEFFVDGAWNPPRTSQAYHDNCIKYKALADRVFLLYEPLAPNTSPGASSRLTTAEVDIVLLHGIGSNEFKCWTNRQGVLWPAVFLPQDFPAARVLTVGYAHSLFNWGEHDAHDTAVKTSPPNTVHALQNAADGAVVGATDVPQVPSSDSARDALRYLAERVEDSALASVTAYAPAAVSAWLARVGEQPPSRTETPSVPTSVESPMWTRAPLSTSRGPSASSVSSQTIRDTAALQPPSRGGAPTAPPSDVKPADGCSCSPTKSGDVTGGGSGPAVPLDPRRLQSMRLVAAQLARRLLDPSVGVGQRPVIFVVHSMGGLIVKQMVVQLFDAVQRAPSPVSAPSTSAISGGCLTAPQESGMLTEPRVAVTQATAFLRSLRGVVFYSTPHFGSALASVVTGLKQYYQGLGGLTPTDVVTGMGDHNRTELTSLNDRFLDVVERLGSDGPLDKVAPEEKREVTAANFHQDAQALFVATMETSLISKGQRQQWHSGPGRQEILLAGCTGSQRSLNGGNATRGAVAILSFGESKKLNGLVRVVEPESANPAPRDPRYPFYLVEADHSQVNRPLTKTSPSYAMLYGFLQRMQQRASSTRRPPPEECDGRRRLDKDGKSIPPSTSGDETAIALLSEEYEAGWTALFDRSSAARVATSSLVDGAVAAATLPEPLDNSKGWGVSFHRVHRAALLRRSIGEARAALTVLNDATSQVRQLARAVYGLVVPSQLDTLFLLAVDMREYIDDFYGHARCVAAEAGTADHDVTRCTPDRPCSVEGGGVLIDEAVSFCLPLQLVTIRAREAASVLRSLPQMQQESSLRMGGGGHSDELPSHLPWEIGTFMHRSSRNFEALRTFERHVGVLREEWETFRRYASLWIRATYHESCSGITRSGSCDSMRISAGYTTPMEALPLASHVGALLFARSIRMIATDASDKDDTPSGLFGAYLTSSIEQVCTDAKKLPRVHMDDNVWLPLMHSAPIIASTVVSSVVEGLRWSSPMSCHERGDGALMDKSGDGARAALTVPLHAVAPALTATSSLLLGWVCLYVDDQGYADAGARRSRALHLFQQASSALTVDGRMRARLFRAASVAGAVADEAPVRQMDPVGNGVRGGERQAWWKMSWQQTVQAVPDPRGGGIGPFTDRTFLRDEEGRCHRHVAVLDDGLFLSAMQLVVATWQCSVLGDMWRAEAKLRTLLPRNVDSISSSWTSTSSAEQPGLPTQGDAIGHSAIHVARELKRVVRAAHAAYGRTSQVARGVPAVQGSERLFAAPEKLKQIAVGKWGRKRTSSVSQATKDRLRDTIRGLLQELERPDGADGAEPDRGEGQMRISTEGHAGERDVAVPNEKQWRGRIVPGRTESAKPLHAVLPAASSKPSRRSSDSSSLPIFIMNSLAKAWEEVRRGGRSAPTPEMFAYNAMVMWWVVEWELLDVMKACAAPGIEVDSATVAAATPPDGIHETMLKAEAAVQRRCAAVAASLKFSTTMLAAATPSACSTAGEQQCWLQASASLRSRWLTLAGGREVRQRTLTKSLAAERRILRCIEAAASPAELEDAQKEFQHLCEGSAASPTVPAALREAAQLTDSSAALHCWLGHCDALHNRASWDAAQAYLQAICNDHSREKRYATVAEVGLAWNHVHQVPCAALPLWRVVASKGCEGEFLRWCARYRGELAAAAAGTSAVSQANTALLHFDEGAVLDMSAQYGVPVTLLHFWHDAVIHHVATAEQYRHWRGQTSSLVGASRSSPASSCTLSAASAAIKYRWHLRLAEDGFRRTLQRNPMNVGALCGLGRLRCLSVRRGAASTVPSGGLPGVLATSSTTLWSPSSISVVDNGGGDCPDLPTAEAMTYFHAALQAASAQQIGEPSAESSNEACLHAMDAVWCSYAAHGLSEASHHIRSADTGHHAEPAMQGSMTMQWLWESLRHYPRNDWALTSLGLSYLRAASPSPAPPCTPDADHQKADLSKLRGLAFLNRALEINPTNLWALWGVGTYGGATPQRDTCQRLVRHAIVQRLRQL